MAEIKKKLLWLWFNILIIEGESIELGSEGGLSRVQSTLSISNVTKDDIQTYSCTAKNKALFGQL